jgi:ABC-type multidrug transport system permease subunit
LQILLATLIDERSPARTELLNSSSSFRTIEAPAQGSKGGRKGFNIVAFILPAMASAFLLFLADHSLRDLLKEQRAHTLHRIRMISPSLISFVVSKVFFAAATVFLGAMILVLSGKLLFQIDWHSPFLLLLVCAGYALFASGFLAMFIALLRNERQVESLTGMFLLAVSFLGGSYIPPNILPPLVRDYFWFAEALRSLSGAAVSNPQTFLKIALLAVAGGIMACTAVTLLHKKMLRGGYR